MNNIQKIKCEWPEGQNRVETGAVQFNDDWPALHIRGDNAAYLHSAWQRIQENLPTEFKQQFYLEIAVLDGFLETIQTDVII